MFYYDVLTKFKKGVISAYTLNEEYSNLLLKVKVECF